MIEKLAIVRYLGVFKKRQREKIKTEVEYNDFVGFLL